MFVRIGYTLCPFLQAPPIMLVAVGGAGLAGKALSDPGYTAAQFYAASFSVCF